MGPDPVDNSAECGPVRRCRRAAPSEQAFYGGHPRPSELHGCSSRDHVVLVMDVLVVWLKCGASLWITRPAVRRSAPQRCEPAARSMVEAVSVLIDVLIARFGSSYSLGGFAPRCGFGAKLWAQAGAGSARAFFNGRSTTSLLRVHLSTPLRPRGLRAVARDYCRFRGPAGKSVCELRLNEVRRRLAKDLVLEKPNPLLRLPRPACSTALVDGDAAALLRSASRDQRARQDLDTLKSSVTCGTDVSPFRAAVITLRRNSSGYVFAVAHILRAGAHAPTRQEATGPAAAPLVVGVVGVGDDDRAEEAGVVIRQRQREQLHDHESFRSSVGQVFRRPGIDRRSRQTSRDAWPVHSGHGRW